MNLIEQIKSDNMQCNDFMHSLHGCSDILANQQICVILITIFTLYWTQCAHLLYLFKRSGVLLFGIWIELVVNCVYDVLRDWVKSKKTEKKKQNKKKHRNYISHINFFFVLRGSRSGVNKKNIVIGHVLWYTHADNEYAYIQIMYVVHRVVDTQDTLIY